LFEVRLQSLSIFIRISITSDADLLKYSLAMSGSLIPKHKEEATDDIREKGERG
jgi:hypothetical protein